MFTGQICIVSPGMEGKGQPGSPVYGHLPCAAGATEGTSGDAPEAVGHTRNRMETKWKRLTLMSRD